MQPRKKMIGFVREALGLSESVSIEFSSLQGRGSDRSFYRLKWNRKHSVILVQYDPKRLENTYYVDIAVFLLDIDVPVPRLIRHDPTRCLIVMEDLGDTDLWALRETPWETQRPLYQKTLTMVHRLHSFPENRFPSPRVKLMESFGPDLYRWEQNYFRDHFVTEVCRIELEPSFERELEIEFSSLSQRLEGTRRCLIHRDLQSQNVMVRDGKPFLIDFQGMRFGSFFYDLASLLCDPYVNLSGSQQEELLSVYYGLTKRDLDWTAFQNRFWEASAQRLMQALGAYGFLGLRKGLKSFLDHIPAGLRHLQFAASQVAFLRRLQQLSWECQDAMEKKE